MEGSLQAWIVRGPDPAFETERAKICIHYNWGTCARARALMDKKRYSAIRELWEEAPQLKEFKPRCKNLDILESYSESEDLAGKVLVEMEEERLRA